MSCKYSFNNKIYNSYDELLTDLAEHKGLSEALSLLFSKDLENRQATMKDKIEKLKKNYSFTKQSSIVDDDTDIKVEDGKYTSQTFIDSAYFSVNGNYDMFRMNKEDYAKRKKEYYMKVEKMSEEDATFKVNQILANWERIAKDASDLHRILVSASSDDSERYFMGASLNTSFQKVSDQLRPTVDSIMKNIWDRQKDSTLIRNINIEAKLKNLMETIVGHIDYLFVKPDGDIEIFNLKVSTEAESQWDATKKEKFKYQLALIKKILEYNGINARDIRLNLIPVQITYDDKYENVVKVLPQRYVSYDTKNSQYIFQRYDNVASQFIDSNIEVSDINDSSLIKVNEQLHKIFPGRDKDIAAEGIKESAKGWVQANWKQIATQAVDKKGWNIKLPGEKESIYVEDTRVGVDNETVVGLVRDREESLFGNTARAKTTYRIVSDIKKSYKDKHNFLSTSSNSEINGTLERQLGKYFHENNGLDEDGHVTEYKWELIDNQTLFNANVLMFRNKTTNQLDVISLTPFEVDLKSKVKGRDNLLGYYLPDMNSYNFIMESNYGNIEAIRTMTLLNEVIGSLGNIELGQLKIISLSKYHRKTGRDIMISQLLPQFETVVKVVKENNSMLDFQNNFKKNNIKTIDPIKIVVDTWREAVTDYPENTKDIQATFNNIMTGTTGVDGVFVDGLETINTIEGKINKLQQLIEMIKSYDAVIGNANIQQLIDYSKDTTRIQRATTARILINALRALNMYNGDLSLDNEYFSQMSEYFIKPQSIPNTNVRTVAFMFQRSIDKISGQMLERYSPIRTKILNFLEKKGYSATENSLIGNHAAQFDNLYERDLNGEKTLRFKNPYDMSVNLEDYERDFLKDILYEMNKIRHEMKGMTWEYTGVNDKDLIDKVNKGELGYLNVPLKKASKTTRRENISKIWKDFGRRWQGIIRHPKETFLEFSEGLLSEEEKIQRDDDIQRLQAYNPFLKSEMSSNLRQNYIDKNGVDYFETDLETIMIDFMEKHIQSVEFNKMLTRTKGILLDLQMRGIAEDDPKGIEHTVKTINDYLAVSVYNKSIMEDTSKKIENVLDPIRRAISVCYIAANPVAMVRDISEGIKQNIVRSLIKFQTDITPKDVAHGYTQVVLEGPQNVMTISKLNQLNLKYRFSNLDVARISEGLKTSGSGILNADSMAYFTLRAPDYLNRMVLFSAKMHHDGVEDAYYIKDGQLVYDWKKDKRFNVYNDPNGFKNNPEEYNKQRSKYLSLLRQFNKEGRLNKQGKPFVEGDALPDAYTEQQIAAFKNFSDNIYGSYNQSTRAKYEHTIIGRNFGIFSTWMNGIIDNYAKKRQISQSEIKEVQETDDNGKPLFFAADGTTTDIDTGVPVIKDVPLEVQGIINTVIQFAKEWINNGLKEAIDVSYKHNDINRRNFNKLFSDIFMMLLYGAIFKLALDPIYEDHKKNGDGKNIIKNALTELTYKGWHNSWDGFFGPLSVLEYVGNSTNPATYKLPTKLFNDLYKLATGDQTLMGTTMGAQAFTRAFRDTYRMYIRDAQ